MRHWRIDQRQDGLDDINASPSICQRKLCEKLCSAALVAQ